MITKDKLKIEIEKVEDEYIDLLEKAGWKKRFAHWDAGEEEPEKVGPAKQN